MCRVTALWTSEEIVAATGGTLHGAPFDVSGVTFDSREVEQGWLFVAMPGTVADGHDFVSKAFAAGAAGALVSKAVEGPHILVEDVPDALTRGAAWVTLWDNLLETHVSPSAFADAAMRALSRETDEQNTQRVLTYLTRTFWRFLPPDERTRRGPGLEAMLRAGLERARTQSQKAAWFNTYRDVVLSREGVAWLDRVWRRDEKVPGLTLAEPDEASMALDLAVRSVPNAAEILKVQYGRFNNPDRKARFEFVMPALSADASMRDQFFENMRNVDRRRREPWVIEALRYTNHPLRSDHARKYIRPGLDLLVEIRRTGDIFFPKNWMDALLSGHNSPEAAETVREFLREFPQYPGRLRQIIQQSADLLFRASGSNSPQS
jgi:aminopeptidase N